MALQHPRPSSLHCRCRMAEDRPHATMPCPRSSGQAHGQQACPQMRLTGKRPLCGRFNSTTRGPTLGRATWDAVSSRCPPASCEHRGVVTTPPTSHDADSRFQMTRAHVPEWPHRPASLYGRYLERSARREPTRDTQHKRATCPAHLVPGARQGAWEALLPPLRTLRRSILATRSKCGAAV